MANFVYKKAKENILNGNIDFSSDQFKIALIKTSLYTYNENIDEDLSDIPSTAIVARSAALSNVSNTLGVIDANDLLISLAANKSFEAIVFFQNKTSDSESKLIFYIDTAEGLPYPGSLSETTVDILWSNNSLKILSL